MKYNKFDLEEMKKAYYIEWQRKERNRIIQSWEKRDPYDRTTRIQGSSTDDSQPE